MNRIVAAFLLLLASTASGLCQIPGGAEIQLHRTPITGGAVVGDCLTVGTGNTVSQAVCGSGSVTTFSAGTTGFTPSSATSGAVTLAGILVGANGGTGVANTGKTITLGGNLTTSGAFASTFTMTGATGVTFPTSGTLLSSASVIPLTVGTTTIASGTTTRILYDNAGVLGEYTLSGSGTVVAMQTGAALITPAIGVATGTSLALGGATLGTNALAVTGTSLLTGVVTVNNGGSSLVKIGVDSNFTNYNAITLNGLLGDATTMGMIGGGVGDSSLFINTPSGGTVILRVAGAGLVTVAPATTTLANQLNITAMTQTAAAQSGTVCYNSGTGAVTYDATLGCLASSERFKTDIVDIQRPDALAMTMALAPVSFRKRGEFGGSVDASYHVGFIAEQVADVDERLVSRNEEGVRGVRYQELTAILAGAVQELKREINELRAAKQ